MIVTLCYIVLCLTTLYVGLTAIRIIKISSSLILVIPLFAMYFWSIYGAWSLIPLKLEGNSIWYEDLAYTINIDHNYLCSLILYSIFIIVFGTLARRIARCYTCSQDEKTHTREKFKNYIERLSRKKLYYLIIYLFLGLFVYYSMKNISVALSRGVSGYDVGRFDSSLVKGFGSMIAFFGDTSLYLSVPLLFSKARKKKILIIIPILIYFFINFLLGNRATLMGGLILALLFFTELYGLKQVLRPKYLIWGCLGLITIQTISFVRGLSVSQILSGNFHVNILDVLASTSESNEKYAAHMSMYGILSKDVAPTWGSSLLFLLSSFFPAFMGVPRPDEIYVYYIKHTVNGDPHFGITIHHATAWYLNFGLLGIVVGALMWGFVFKYLYSRKYKFIFFYGSVLFSAASLQMIRGGGLESYKGALILATIVPMIIVRFCLNKIKIFPTLYTIKHHRSISGCRKKECSHPQ